MVKRKVEWLQLDPHPFARGGSVAIVAVSCTHILQATLLLYSHTTGNATGMHALLLALQALRIGGDGGALAIIMFATAALALVGALYRLGWVRLAIFIPQHILLGIMAIGGLTAAYEGTYLDGVVKPWPHILADQIVVTAVFVVHTSAIIRRARDPNG